MWFCSIVYLINFTFEFINVLILFCKTTQSRMSLVLGKWRTSPMNCSYSLVYRGIGYFDDGCFTCPKCYRLCGCYHYRSGSCCRAAWMVGSRILTVYNLVSSRFHSIMGSCRKSHESRADENASRFSLTQVSFCRQNSFRSDAVTYTANGHGSVRIEA